LFIERRLDSLRGERYVSFTYDKFQAYVRRAVEDAGTTQEAIIQFREDLRSAVGRITSIMDGELSVFDVSGYFSEHMLGVDAKEMPSYSTENNDSILEIAVAVEECRAVLEEFRD
jgi:hypothetical protein